MAPRFCMEFMGQKLSRFRKIPREKQIWEGSSHEDSFEALLFYDFCAVKCLEYKTFG